MGLGWVKVVVGGKGNLVWEIGVIVVLRFSKEGSGSGSVLFWCVVFEGGGLLGLGKLFNLHFIKEIWVKGLAVWVWVGVGGK